MKIIVGDDLRVVPYLWIYPSDVVGDDLRVVPYLWIYPSDVAGDDLRVVPYLWIYPPDVAGDDLRAIFRPSYFSPAAPSYRRSAHRRRRAWAAGQQHRARERRFRHPGHPAGR